MNRVFHFIGHSVWMACNLVVVLLLLAAALACVVPPTTLRVPALLAIGFEWLVFANVFFGVSWLFTHRKSWSLVSLLAIGVAWMPLRSTFAFPQKTEKDEAAHELRVLTYNTHLLQNNTPVERNELLRYIHDSDADIVCMQEYAVYKDGKYPTFQRVKSMLEDVYPYTYFDFAVHNQRLQYGLAVYSKYPLIHKTSIPIHASGNGANFCDVVVRGDTFRLFNNHLQSNSLKPSEIDSLLSKNPKDYTLHALRTSPNNTRVSSKLFSAFAARKDQVETIRPLIESSPYPVIVCGDFNDVPASYAYRQLSRGLRDAFLTSSVLGTGHTYVRSLFGVRIDYILTDPKLRADSFRVDKLMYSDHYPVRATLYW